MLSPPVPESEQHELGQGSRPLLPSPVASQNGFRKRLDQSTPHLPPASFGFPSYIWLARVNIGN